MLLIFQGLNIRFDLIFGAVHTNLIQFAISVFSAHIGSDFSKKLKSFFCQRFYGVHRALDLVLLQDPL